MDFLAVIIGFLKALILDNARLYWYIPVHKEKLPYKAIRVELFPYMLLKLVYTPVIWEFFHPYVKGLRFLATTGDRFLSNLIKSGCKIDEIRSICYNGLTIGQYEYVVLPVNTWKEAEKAELERHLHLYGIKSALDISTLDKTQQELITGKSLTRKYDLYAEKPFKEPIEIKYGQAYVEDYTN